MKFSALIPLVAFAARVVGAALPSTDNTAAVDAVAGTEPSVTFTVARNQACDIDKGSPEHYVTASTKCMQFPAGTSSLRVVKVSGDDLRYNSLRVYHNDACHGYGDIEPAWGCAAPGAGGCGCSAVEAYKSIRLVLDW